MRLINCSNRNKVKEKNTEKERKIKGTPAWITCNMPEISIRYFGNTTYSYTKFLERRIW
jgi:hypothetical protein